MAGQAAQPAHPTECAGRGGATVPPRAPLRSHRRTDRPLRLSADVRLARRSARARADLRGGPRPAGGPRRVPGGGPGRALGWGVGHPAAQAERPGARRPLGPAGGAHRGGELPGPWPGRSAGGPQHGRRGHRAGARPARGSARRRAGAAPRLGWRGPCGGRGCAGSGGAPAVDRQPSPDAGAGAGERVRRRGAAADRRGARAGAPAASTSCSRRPRWDWMRRGTPRCPRAACYTTGSR